MLQRKERNAKIWVKETTDTLGKQKVSVNVITFDKLSTINREAHRRTHTHPYTMIIKLTSTHDRVYKRTNHKNLCWLVYDFPLYFRSVAEHKNEVSDVEMPWQQEAASFPFAT